MKPSPYDHLSTKPPDQVLRDLDQLDSALSVVTERGLAWLDSQFVPAGPIMRERSVSLVYKVVWAFSESERHRSRAGVLLDWLQEEAIQASGDIYFPEEPEAERDGTRWVSDEHFHARCSIDGSPASE